MTFHIGQKVVCISVDKTGRIARYCSGGCKIAVGQVYTIREIDTRAVHLHGIAALRFEGLTGEVRQSSIGPWEFGASYPASHFRPVIERKTDISTFEKMLVSNRKFETVGHQ